MATSFDPGLFFDIVRRNLFNGRLTQGQVDGLTFIMRDWKRRHSFGGDHRHLAYMLATTHHETAFTIQPVTEYGSIKYLKAKPYYPYVGRGYCQLTWDYNYTKAGKATDEDLLNFPETALNADVACTVMYEGMTYGWFTGKKLSDYFNETRDDPVNARRIINGLDRAKKIATYHKQYLHAIRSALQPI